MLEEMKKKTKVWTSPANREQQKKVKEFTQMMANNKMKTKEIIAKAKMKRLQKEVPKLSYKNVCPMIDI